MAHPPTRFLSLYRMTQPLWYVRREDDVRGPYPAPVISQHLMLGRLNPDSQISLDGQSWMTVATSGYFRDTLAQLALPPEAQGWESEREKARRRWLDERDRVEPLATEVEEKRAGESAMESALRQDHQDTRHLLADQKRRPGGRLAVMAALGLLATIGAVVFLAQSDQPLRTPVLARLPDCAAGPSDGVNWSGCDKRNARLTGASLGNGVLARARLDGADLRQARLTYAELAQVSLRGADLTGADLTGADLTGADLTGANLAQAGLSYANLTRALLDGVRLDGAHLDKTTWVDGRTCVAGSLGVCR